MTSPNAILIIVLIESPLVAENYILCGSEGGLANTKRCPQARWLEYPEVLNVKYSDSDLFLTEKQGTKCPHKLLKQAVYLVIIW